MKEDLSRGPMLLAAQVRGRWRDLVLPAGEVNIPIERHRSTALIRLSVVVPLAIGPTNLYLHHCLSNAWHPSAGRWAWMAHLLFLTLYVGVNGALLWLTRPGQFRKERTLRQLNAVAVICELGTNQAFMSAFGALANYAISYLILIIALYRVIFDYRTALTTFILGILTYLLFGFLEVSGAMPIGPLRPTPVIDPFWSTGVQALAPICSVLMVCILTFIICGYAVNQSVRLHQYITRSVLQRYLPPPLVDQAAQGTLRLDDPPERRVVTVIFTDIVGFTRLSEALGADAVGVILNTVLAEIADVAHAHGATVDKFIGDCAMLVFGAPRPLPPAEQVKRALALAVAIHERVPQIGGGHALQARTGLNTGEAVVGNFGSAARSDYTVIGPAVNVAARLEGLSRPGAILLGEDSVAYLSDCRDLECAGPLSLKGVSTPVQGWFYAPSGVQEC